MISLYWDNEKNTHLTFGTCDLDGIGLGTVEPVQDALEVLREAAGLSVQRQHSFEVRYAVVEFFWQSGKRRVHQPAPQTTPELVGTNLGY